MVEEVPSSMLTKHLPLLREHISDEDFEPLPFTVGKGKDQVGYVLPLWLVLEYKKYLEQQYLDHPTNQRAVLTKIDGRTFARSVNDRENSPLEYFPNQSPPIFIIPFTSRDGWPAQTIAIVPEKLYSYIRCLQNSEKIPQSKICPTLSDESDLNMHLLETEAVEQKNFWSDFDNLRTKISPNEIVYRKAMDMAAIPVRYGKWLKQHAFFGDASIIKKVETKQSERSSAEATRLINQGHYLHVNGRSNVAQGLVREHMVIPALSSEFLNLDDNGSITGIREEKTKSVKLNFEIELSTDFKSAAHVHVKIDSETQRQVVERALQHLHQAEKTISLFDHDYKIEEVKSEKRKKLQTRFFIPTRMQFSSLLSIQGDFTNTSLFFDKGADVAETALDMNQRCNIHFNGKVYSLTRA